ncbi:ubiquitin protein ligase-like, partial [Tropilaelaps mercedesae]
VKRIFGGSGTAGTGGQAQLLQMVIYFLVIVCVITSFDGLNYQQIMAERRPNRFVFTSVVYPAMLILGLTVTKLDNKLAYGATSVVVGFSKRIYPVNLVSSVKSQLKGGHQPEDDVAVRVRQYAALDIASPLRRFKQLPMDFDPSAILLRRQLHELNKHPVEGFSAGLVDDSDIYKWQVLIIGPPDTPYEGGLFKAQLLFPKEYPLRPPKMTFVSDIWHPNIAKTGEICISILHEPGDDKYGYEKANERWLPVHTVETILISVISLLSEPNDASPANIDAAKEWRDNYAEFKRKVARCVRQSHEKI